VLELLVARHEVLVLDNLCNSSKVALDRVEQLAGRTLQFVKGDVRNRSLLNALFASYPITAVLHFAGLKAVGESVREPLRYYETNVSGSIALCQAMAEAGIFKLVFSSSATVYGDSPRMPITENCPTGLPTNPYGQSKLMAENVLKGLAESDPRWSIALLRYFNPIGAHESGLIGEDPNGIPNNLLPYMLQVAVGRRPHLSVYGADYPPPDGTGVRDYIHVVDLAKGHLRALERLDLAHGVSTWNLGTGRGYSVRQMITAFEEVIGKPLPHIYKARRPGDIAQCWSDTTKAREELGWEAEKGLLSMLSDAWKWQSRNPQGYATEQVATENTVASATALAS
jgi:UDP-glucose 4-epimerase